LPAFGRECVAPWRLALATLRRMPAPPPAPRGLAVILPEAGVPAAAYALLSAHLAAAGWCSAVARQPARRIDPDAAAAALTACVAAHRLPGLPIVLLGHGLGGLWARHHMQHGRVAEVRRLVTLGTPHQGTSALVTRLPCGRALRADGAWIRALNTGDRVADQFDVIAIASPFDAWIVPAANADYRGAFNVSVRGIGHLALLASPHIAELVVENLNAA
jgi:triacylglycerol esterase/lipase EstA (alpha/beta hydrolase family)